MPGVKRPVPEREKRGHERDRDREHVERTKRRRLSTEPAASDSDDIDEEALIEQATQLEAQQKALRNSRENLPVENGIIEQITLVNFMCHSYLEVDIGPLINFIIGHNGSGKSAILTALMICLGGKANSTNRAASLKSFVKQGQESCTVTVKIKNAGETGYQSDLYGSSIIVERTINISGASGFKLKSANGRTISTKKGDLEEISDYYAMQLDNPISVLTQDNSRQFLNSSSPTDKYKFFLKGVQLEQLNQDYNLLQESIEQIEATLPDKQFDLEHLEKKKDRAKHKMEQISKQDDMRARADELGKQVAWSQVEDQERRLNSIVEEIQAVEEQSSEARELANEASTKLEEIDGLRAEAEQEVQRLKDSLIEEESTKERAKNSSDNLKEEVKSAHRDQRNIGEKVKGLTREMEEHERDIEKEMQRLEEINGGSHARRLAELDSLKSDVEQAKQDYNSHGEGRRALEQREAEAGDIATEAQSSYKAKKKQKDDCTKSLDDLRNSRSQQTGFPQNMDRLLSQITRERYRFSTPPIGPIGNLVQLRDHKWSSILEKSFGTTLNGFLVTSKADQNELYALMGQVRCSCPIFIGSEAPIDTTGNEPDRQFATMLRVLKIESEAVKRLLVMNHSIEQTILIEDMKEARHLMNRSKPRNVKQCFSINPAKRGYGVRLAYGIADSVNSSFVEAYVGAPRMRSLLEDRISFETNQLSNLDRELNEANDLWKKRLREQEDCRKELKRHEKANRDLKIKVQQAEAKVESAQEALDEDTIEEGRIDTLREFIAQKKDQKEDLEKLYKDSVREKEKHHTALRKVIEEMAEIDNRIESAKQDLRTAQEKQGDVKERRVEILKGKNDALHNVDELKKKIEALEAQRARKEDVVRDWTSKASEFGERVPIPRNENPTSLQTKLSKIIKDVKRFEERVGGNKEKISADYQRAVERYESAFNTFKSEKDLVEKLSDSLKERKDKWRYFRHVISARAKVTFMHVLSARNFRGRLNISHSQRRLDIEIQPDETQSGNNGSATNALSGGEKSFSTLCLLLSLWEAVGAPIRCLDEFDVFMDSVNRDVSMKLLIRAARDAAGRQFIFISPQAGIVDTSRDVKIIKLRDPERNQTQIRL